MLFFDIALLFVLGLAVGSFLNAFLWRLHEGVSLTQGRSMCPHCKTQLLGRDLVPLLSFLILRGRCRACKMPISYQYPLVELATGLIFVGIGMIFAAHTPGGILAVLGGGIPAQTSLQLVAYLLFAAILIALFVYDLHWYLLPDIITIPSIIAAFIVNGFLLSTQPFNLLIAALIGGGFFLFQYLISRGRWVGGGDIRLGVLMGCMLGYPGIGVALFLAYMMGSIVGIGLLIGKKKGMKSEVPFGPFLTLATLIVLLFQNDILTTLFALGIL